MVHASIIFLVFRDAKSQKRCLRLPATTQFFLKWGQKLCPNQFIKKKRIAQLINGKPGTKTDTTKQLENHS
jgi:hypothetical protein